MKLKENGISILLGILFAVGLGISGMTNPAKVLGFLNLLHWDPSLAFVMGGALTVYAIGFKWIYPKMEKPVIAQNFDLPKEKNITPRLIIGATLFGIGWALTGFCPGPGIVAVGSKSIAAFVFLGTAILGILLFKAFDKQKVEPNDG